MWPFCLPLGTRPSKPAGLAPSPTMPTACRLLRSPLPIARRSARKATKRRRHSCKPHSGCKNAEAYNCIAIEKTGPRLALMRLLTKVASWRRRVASACTKTCLRVPCRPLCLAASQLNVRGSTG